MTVFFVPPALHPGVIEWVQATAGVSFQTTVFKHTDVHLSVVWEIKFSVRFFTRTIIAKPQVVICLVRQTKYRIWQQVALSLPVHQAWESDVVRDSSRLCIVTHLAILSAGVSKCRH